MSDPITEGITNQLIADNQILTRERDELKAKVDELEKDKARLDWMIKTGRTNYSRHQIDAAMKGGAQ